MTVMSVREFNSNTSKALSRAASGEIITLTNRGRPFVRIGPEPARLMPGTPEWQAAYDRAVEGMKRGFPLGGTKVTYEERTE